MGAIPALAYAIRTRMVMLGANGLGARRQVSLPGASIEYHDVGTGPTVLFLHGLLTSPALWRGVVPAVTAAGYRAVLPVLPLGGHRLPAPPDADLRPPALADLIADFLGILDLNDVTLVANDTGGALAQILVTRRPTRIGRLVLTPSDSLDRFFPPLYRYLTLAGRIPGSAWLMTHAMRFRALRDLPFTFGWMTHGPFPADLLDEFLAPSRRRPAIRRDLRRFLAGVHRRYTLAAAERFGEFRRPVLLVWAREDRVFPVAVARRLEAAFPDAQLVLVDGSRTYLPIDRPDALADHLVAFLHEHTG